MFFNVVIGSKLNTHCVNHDLLYFGRERSTKFAYSSCCLVVFSTLVNA